MENSEEKKTSTQTKITKNDLELMKSWGLPIIVKENGKLSYTKSTWEAFLKKKEQMTSNSKEEADDFEEPKVLENNIPEIDPQNIINQVIMGEGGDIFKNAMKSIDTSKLSDLDFTGKTDDEIAEVLSKQVDLKKVMEPIAKSINLPDIDFDDVAENPEVFDPNEKPDPAKLVASMLKKFPTISLRIMKNVLADKKTLNELTEMSEKTYTEEELAEIKKKKDNEPPSIVHDQFNREVILFMNFLENEIPAENVKWKKKFAAKCETFLKFASKFPKEPLQLYSEQTSAYKKILKKFTEKNVMLFKQNCKKVSLLNLIGMDEFLDHYLKPENYSRLPEIWKFWEKLDSLERSSDNVSPSVMKFFSSTISSIQDVKRSGKMIDPFTLLNQTVDLATQDNELFKTIAENQILSMRKKGYSLDPQTENLMDDIEKLESESGYEKLNHDS